MKLQLAPHREHSPCPL